MWELEGCAAVMLLIASNGIILGRLWGIPWGIPSQGLTPTVFHSWEGRVARRVRVLVTRGSGDRVWSRDRVVFGTTRDTSRDRSDVWSRAGSRAPEGGRGSREGFPGSRGRVGAFSA